ncbi:MAG: 3-hydroxyacyl-CoA dehydrogenase NAD-binding domain-containing protein, partial [Pseudomonadota bacterium]
MTALPVSMPVAIIGAGTMGAGIAQVAAEAGHPVLLYDMADGAAEGGRNRIETGLVKLVERGKRTDKERADVMGRITATDRLDALSPAGLAIEAIVEDQAVKTEVFRQLESLLSDEAILSSNT